MVNHSPIDVELVNKSKSQQFCTAQIADHSPIDVELVKKSKSRQFSSAQMTVNGILFDYIFSVKKNGADK